MTKLYPLVDTIPDLTSKDIQFFKCNGDKIIDNCYRQAYIANIGGVGVVNRCMSCVYSTGTTSIRSLPFIDPAAVGSFKYVDSFTYLPTNATQHFKTKSNSYESIYERTIGYSGCQ